MRGPHRRAPSRGRPASGGSRPPHTPTPHTLTLTVNTIFSEIFLAGPWALGGGTSLECLEPQTRRAQSHGPHGREPLVCPQRPRRAAVPTSEAPAPSLFCVVSVQENNSPHKDPFISAPRCLPKPYPPTARGQCPHVAGGANQGSAANLSGREQLGLVSSRTGRLWVWPGACHTPGAAFPRQQGLGLRGRGGQDRLGERARPSPPSSVTKQDALGPPGTDWALSSARLSFAEKRQPPRPSLSSRE